VWRRITRHNKSTPHIPLPVSVVDTWLCHRRTDLKRINLWKNRGNLLPTTPPQYPTPLPNKSGRRRLIIIIVVVVAVVVVALNVGLYFYSENVAYGVTSFCSSETTNSTSGGVNIVVTFGIKNPSSLSVKLDLRRSIDFGGGVVLVNEQVFNVPSNGVAYPNFTFTATSSQLSQINSATTFTITDTVSANVLWFTFSNKSVSVESSSSPPPSTPSC
jgi:hypothetical protein